MKTDNELEKLVLKAKIIKTQEQMARVIGTPLYNAYKSILRDYRNELRRYYDRPKTKP